jgi:hypothetical protein
MCSANWEQRVVCDCRWKWKVSDGAEHGIITDRGEEKEGGGGTEKEGKKKKTLQISRHYALCTTPLKMYTAVLQQIYI